MITRLDNAPRRGDGIPLSPQGEGVGVRRPQTGGKVRSTWPLVPLGEVLIAVDRSEAPIAGNTYRTVGVKWWGEGVYEREPIDGSQTQYNVLRRIEPGDVIINKIWARHGSVAVVQQALSGCYASTEFPTWTAVPDHLDPRWIHWLSKTKSFWEQCDEKSRGTSGKNRIRPEKFLEITIPLPPLDEQRRIVARIETLAGRIAEARRLRQEAQAEAKIMWRSTLLAAFMPDAEYEAYESASKLLQRQAVKYASAERSNFNGAHPWQPNVYDDGPYLIPTTWAWTDLGSVLTQLIDCVNDTPAFSGVATGFLGLKSSNIRPFSLDLTDQWYVIQEDHSRWNRRATPQPGDLILTREAPMGNVCMLPEGITACLTQRLMLLRSDGDFVNGKYLLYFLNSPHFQAQVLEQCRGLTTPHIRVKDAPFLRVPLPPRFIQHQIVAYLDDAKAKIDKVQRLGRISCTELDALLPAVLDRAFRGEL